MQIKYDQELAELDVICWSDSYTVIVNGIICYPIITQNSFTPANARIALELVNAPYLMRVYEAYDLQDADVEIFNDIVTSLRGTQFTTMPHYEKIRACFFSTTRSS